MPGGRRFTFDRAGKVTRPEPVRYVRLRVSLLTGDSQTALLRADTIISAEHLATLIPVVPEAGQIGRWSWDLLPDAPAGGKLLFEILG